MAVKIKCPLCEAKFGWDIVSLGWPDQCPACKQYVGHGRDDSDIVMPSIRTARTKIIDATYTQTEKGSEVRAQLAAEQLGVPVSEMSGLKVTDMNTGMREGDIAAKEPVAEMQRLGVQNPSNLFQGNGAEFSGAVQTGAFANSGAKFQTGLRQIHAERTGHQGVSERPALEVMQPGYRRRA